MSDGKFFRQLTVLSAIASSVSVISLLFIVPLIYFKAEQAKYETGIKTVEFKNEANQIWNSIEAVVGQNDYIRQLARKTRSISGTCRGCIQLNCPSGKSGPPGLPGEDGTPGKVGNPGQAGDDGYDIELAVENELPCVICPAGPPGQRGFQGERGMVGAMGRKGAQGAPGKVGISGPHGNPGLKGPPGKPGPVGKIGPIGDSVIAGVGIKGPKGLPGPAGPKGPMGIRGRLAKEDGPPGMPGETGPQGKPGNAGRSGNEGIWGPPGEPGSPATYCASDCGVSEILAPTFKKEHENDDTNVKTVNDDNLRMIAVDAHS